MFFTIQIASGIVLATIYAPSAAQAYESLVYIDEQVPFGWMLRALHGWSSNAMCIMMLIHLAQVFLHGAYKFPRELTWVSGVFLCLTTLGLAFTGQIMRWDADAYWGLGIGAAIADRAPGIGNQLRALLLGGPVISGATLTRLSVFRRANTFASSRTCTSIVYTNKIACGLRASTPLRKTSKLSKSSAGIFKRLKIAGRSALCGCVSGRQISVRRSMCA